MNRKHLKPVLAAAAILPFVSCNKEGREAPAEADGENLVTITISASTHAPESEVKAALQSDGKIKKATKPFSLPANGIVNLGLVTTTNTVNNSAIGGLIGLIGNSEHETGGACTVDGRLKTAGSISRGMIMGMFNGTTIAESSNLYGLITDKASGKGIKGVPVTDGYKYVLTDANGVYQMTADSRCLCVTMSLPSAYKMPMDEDRQVPAFYANDLDFSWFSRRDFVLEQAAPQTQFTIGAIGDAHIGRKSMSTGDWVQLSSQHYYYVKYASSSPGAASTLRRTGSIINTFSSGGDAHSIRGGRDSRETSL